MPLPNSPLLFVGALLTLSSFLGAEDRKERDQDWREALLTEEGIELTPEALRAALEADAPNEAELARTLAGLGAEKFEDRERAQRELIRGGEAVHQWLRRREPSSDPEIRERVRQAMGILGSGQDKVRKNAVDHALRTLLEEGAQRKADTGGVFYEWFPDPSPKLNKRYHQLHFENPNGRTGRVENGGLLLSGEGGKDGDQKLVLKAGDWPGRQDFGKRFRVTVVLGATPGNAVSWHLGISVGKIRALYHPDFRGGAFRFSRVDPDETPLGDNSDMGFTPPSGSLQTMTIEVEQLPKGDVVLAVTIRDSGNEPKVFEEKIVVPADTIGPLDRISLDRSGRNGGEAVFREFSVTLLPDH